MDRIAEIRERLEKATPGVWRAGRNDTVSYHAWEDGGKAFKNVYCDAVNPEYYLDTPLPEIVAECRDVNGVDCRDIANFIANAHQDIPYLLGIIEQQQAEIERLKPLAELGQLAVELLDTEYCFVPVMRAAFINGLNSHCEGCAALKICRKRAELRVAE